MTRLTLVLAATLLAGCAAAPPAATNPAPGKCPLIGSSNWRAWVNAMPGPGARPTLIVTGSVTVPSGGWDFIWRDARVMESYPVQVAIGIEPLIPQGPATQAVTTREVRYEMPIEPPVASVTVRCGDAILARIAPVETAH
jgi:hypothetical protein